MIRKWICTFLTISLLAMLTACSFRSKDPGKSAEGATSEQAGSLVSFETTDLDGNIVKSSDIFSKNMITMVNIWGTFCSPCIDELPGLEKLRYRLEKKGCAIVGIVNDVESLDDSETIGEAKEIINEIGVTYLNLIPWNGTDDIFPTNFYPTTYFIDSNGKIIGKPVIGAKSEDVYEDMIDELIEEMQ